MALFGESLSSGIAFEQPVTQPDSLTNALNFGSSLLGTLGKRQSAGPSYTERKDLADNANFVELASGIEQAEALRKQGRNRDAERLERKAFTQYAVRGGTVDDKRVTSFYETYTGRPFEYAAQDPRDIAINKIKGTEAFASAMLITAGKDLTPEQREEEALRITFRNETAKQAILDVQNTWTTGIGDQAQVADTQNDFRVLINNFRGKLYGALNTYTQAGRGVSVQDIQAIKAQTLQFQTEIRSLKPVGLPDADWKPIEDMLESVNTEVEFAATLQDKLAGELNSKLTANWLSAVDQSDLSAMDKQIVKDLSADNIIEWGAVSNEDLRNIITSLRNGPKSSDLLLSNDNNYNEYLKESENKDPQESLKEVKDVAKAMRSSKATTPGMQERFFEATTRVAANLYTMGNNDVTPVHSQELNLVFDGSIEAGIRQYEKTDPEKANFLRSKMFEALSVQQDAALTNLEDITKGIFTLNRDTMSFDLDREALKQRYEGRAGFVGEVPQAVEQAAKAYGGDILAMVEDNASRVTPNPALVFFLQSSEVNNIRRSGKQAREYMESFRTLTNIKTRFAPPQQPGDMDQPNAMGGRTTVTPRPAPPEPSKTSSNISVTPPKGVPEETITSFVDRIVELEGFRSTPYKLPNEKYYTVGYGSYGPHVDPSKTYSRKEARELLQKDLNEKFRLIEKNLPEFGTYSEELQTELVQAFYRGDFPRVSPKTLKLIQEGKFEEAAEEFLNNKQYENAEELGIPGIRPRMEAVAQALREEAVRVA